MDSASKHDLHHSTGGAAITVQVAPGAGQTKIIEILGDGTILIQLKSQGVGDQANRILVDFLGQILKVPTKYINILAGQNGPDKLVTILNVDAAHVQEMIFNILNE